jgi:molecular chaperone GrpE
MEEQKTEEHIDDELTNGVPAENESSVGEILETIDEDAKLEEIIEIKSGDLTELKEELESSRKQSEEYLDGWQRTQAEFLNYKKRIDRDHVQRQHDATGNVIKKFLVVSDDLERALKNSPKEGDGANWAEGIELIYRKLETILSNEGITALNPEGQIFDPKFHEAISQEDSPNHESGQIIEVIQQGYLLGERVLRPATVRVAS